MRLLMTRVEVKHASPVVVSCICPQALALRIPVKLETNSFGTPLTPPSSSGKTSRHKKKHHHSSRKRSEAPLTWKGQLLQLAAILLIAAFVYKVTFVTIGWLEEARRPFCEEGQDPLQDNCRPCPENGYCRDGKLRCIPGFRRQGRLCVPDKEIDRNAHNLADFVQNRVCRISGQSLCDNGTTTWVPEEELWDSCKEEKMGLDAESVWLVHEKALQIVRDKLNIRIDDFGLREFECPVALARKYRPLRCQIRQVISSTFSFLRNLQNRKLLARSEELYLQVCEVLEEKAGEASGGTKWVVASRLRDHLLLPSERKVAALWKQVEGLVREDSRIDQYPKLVNGESRVVWEWQGDEALRTASKGAKR